MTLEEVEAVESQDQEASDGLHQMLFVYVLVNDASELSKIRTTINKYGEPLIDIEPRDRDYAGRLQIRHAIYPTLTDNPKRLKNALSNLQHTINSQIIVIPIKKKRRLLWLT